MGNISLWLAIRKIGIFELQNLVLEDLSLLLKRVQACKAILNGDTSVHYFFESVALLNTS